jgi:BCD family chlorophyll transporter-like MFS transporter
MQDVLLEPYGGQVLGMGVGATTWLTAALASGGLAGFGIASAVLGRGACALRMAALGALVGVPAFLAVLAGGALLWVPLFAAGVFAIGLGGGLFGHGTLTATMQAASKEQAGLALGAWGAVQATAAGIGVASGGVLRDLVLAAAGHGWLGAQTFGPAAGYAAVYVVEIALLLATLVVLAPLARRGTPPLLHPSGGPTVHDDAGLRAPPAWPLGAR